MNSWEYIIERKYWRIIFLEKIGEISLKWDFYRNKGGQSVIFGKVGIFKVSCIIRNIKLRINAIEIFLRVKLRILESKGQNCNLRKNEKS